MKKYPCQYCKGRGISERGEFVDMQQVSPDIECGNCEGKGLIEIGGKRHKEIVAERIAMQIISFKRWENYPDGVPYDELMKLGMEALDLVME